MSRAFVRRRLLGLLHEAWLPILLCALWWYLSRNSKNLFFPPLSDIVTTGWGILHTQTIYTDIEVSLHRFLVAIVLAYAGGITIGTCLGLWGLGRRALSPTIDFVRSIPAPAIISVAVLLLGVNDNEKIALIGLATFFPVLLYTIDGVRGVDPQQIEMSEAYRLRKRDTIFRIVLPAASPQIFTGLRLGLTIGLAVLVFAEMFTGTNGLGFFIMYAQNTFQIKAMWTGILILGIIGYLVNIIFLIIERRVLRWHRGWRATTQSAGSGA